MYKIIGVDQKEYGPITTEQIRQWFTQGRVNAQTMVWSDTSNNWKPFSSYAEFADLVAAAPPPLSPASALPFGLDAETARQNALAKVKGPATGLVVTAILTLILIVGSMIWSGPLTKSLTDMIGAGGNGNNPELNSLISSMSGTLNVIGGIINIALSVLVLVGAAKMKQLQSYGLSVTVCILPMIPCVSSCCCFLGLPIGIWGLIVLFKPEVRSQFQ